MASVVFNSNRRSANESSDKFSAVCYCDRKFEVFACSVLMSKLRAVLRGTAMPHG
jgi:hypothetical protein